MRRDAYSVPRMVNYVQTFHDVNGNPLDLTQLLTQNTQITHVNLAALHVTGTVGELNLNDNGINDTYWDTMWSNVTTLQNGGIKVLMMIGGAAQGSYKTLCGSSVPATVQMDYYGPLRDSLRYHNLDGVDLDIEESVDVSCALALLKQFDADFGDDFIMTMAPVAACMIPSYQNNGLSGFSYFTLDSEATDSNRPNGKLVNWYNAQFYNGWGDASTQVFYNNIISEGGWSPDRIVMGVLDSSNDGGSGFVGLSTLQGVIQQLRANYDNFGCAVGWEYWDAGTSDGLDYPWQWVQEISKSIFGASNGTPKNTTSEPLPNPPAPFQALTDELVDLGAAYLQAVWALNITNGDLLAAEQLLNLTSVLDVLDVGII
ncbi:glycoside hydrolase family 18 protein [Baudoinia panamericana UAMH 10762]|uniref:chitinase n=1 Tax=Baudoinia panamericana (strain UAMH 10762) TaxID=717646 RepID=M2MNZ9_BAUPA|nr:glycoside hydrolase family 18 protein [Baudoinia panamericana UAMH 10762]EMC93193.1 glycoside hydrolase family 18 protein [Baudoinia panamericana UAMH 10762]